MIINWVWGKFKVSTLQQTETKSTKLPVKKGKVSSEKSKRTKKR